MLSIIAMSWNQIKYFIFLVASIVGNPFYQMVSYVICWENKIGTFKSTNVFQANAFTFILMLVIIFFIRLLIYKVIFTSKEYPFTMKGTSSFLYIFAERHSFQVIGILSLTIWLSPLEGNIVGFIVLPLATVLGLAVSIITFSRILKTKKIYNRVYGSAH